MSIDLQEPNDLSLQRETYRLVRENNAMLHAARRSAFFGGVIKVVFYIIVLVVAPLWLWQTYLAPMVQTLQDATGKAQSVSGSANVEIQSLQNTLKQLMSSMPSLNLGTSTSQ